jgi:hypothetical protein
MTPSAVCALTTLAFLLDAEWLTATAKRCRVRGLVAPEANRLAAQVTRSLRRIRPCICAFPSRLENAAVIVRAAHTSVLRSRAASQIRM